MKRHAFLVALALVAVALVAGCQKGSTTTGGTSGKSAGAGTGSGTVVTEGLDPIPTDGPGESAAVAGLPAALKAAKPMREGAGGQWPDLKGVEPRLTAYLLIAEMNGQIALFEVRADGMAHSLYAYQKAFDAGTIVWTPADAAGASATAPQSEPEKAAVAAVQAAMGDAFPGGGFTVSVYGYRFSYVDGTSRLLTLEVTPDGSVISVGS